jgi:hypothetical protein
MNISEFHNGWTCKKCGKKHGNLEKVKYIERIDYSKEGDGIKVTCTFCSYSFLAPTFDSEE